MSPPDLPPDDRRRRPRSKSRPGSPALRAVPPLPAETPVSQGSAFPIRLDPNSPPGEFHFVVPAAAGPTEGRVPRGVEADGPIPHELVNAVDEVLGFIFGLDDAPPPGKAGRGKRP
ncbi:MAG: hypothetical protein VKP62_07885 [Candidatus Sericytochromatia bacterium]|nr:hypothetical protein [Candidatus Sericytochromatia bacterium]